MYGRSMKIEFSEFIDIFVLQGEVSRSCQKRQMEMEGKDIYVVVKYFLQKKTIRSDSIQSIHY